MNSQARDKLRDLIASTGNAALDTPRVLAFQLGQTLAEMPAERDVLLAALNKGFIEKLRGKHVGLDGLAEEMSRTTNLKQEDARWALESWAEVVGGVRSKTLDKADDFSPWAKTKGLSYRPPTAEQFARSGLIAGIIAGVLVGALWGGVKALSLARPIHGYAHSRTYNYPQSSNSFDEFDHSYSSGSYYGSRQTIDYKFTRPSIIAWLGWIVAGGLIGCVVGGTSALYLSGGNMRWVGGYSGAAVGALAGLMNGHRLISMGSAQNPSLTDTFADATVGLLIGALAGVILGGFRDLIVNFRSDMPSPIFRIFLGMRME
jgi:hypothetical protein